MYSQQCADESSYDVYDVIVEHKHECEVKVTEIMAFCGPFVDLYFHFDISSHLSTGIYYEREHFKCEVFDH